MTVKVMNTRTGKQEMINLRSKDPKSLDKEKQTWMVSKTETKNGPFDTQLWVP